MLSKQFVLVILASVFVSICGESIRAQEFALGARAVTSAANGLSVLQTKQAQADLGLTPAQIAAARVLQQEHISAMQKKIGGLRGQPEDESETIMQELTADMNKKIAGLLTPEQLKRHAQIMLQMRGYAAFLDPEVQVTLGLSDEQNSKVRGMRDEIVNEARALAAAPKDERKVAMLRYANYKDKALANVLRILTADQKKAWADLVGKEFQKSSPGGVPPKLPQLNKDGQSPRPPGA